MLPINTCADCVGCNNQVDMDDSFFKLPDVIKVYSRSLCRNYILFQCFSCDLICISFTVIYQCCN